MAVLYALLVVVLLVLAARYIHGRSPKQRRRKQIQALLLACRGDRELLERLIFVEMQRDGAVDYSEAARRATARLKRDQR